MRVSSLRANSFPNAAFEKEKQRESMRTQAILPFLFCLLFTLPACNFDQERTTEEYIAADDSKVWFASRQLAPEGGEELTNDEQVEERIRFYADYEFIITSADEEIHGNWSYDPETEQLELQFDEMEAPISYEVLDIDSKRMRLRAGDGSELVLRVE